MELNIEKFDPTTEQLTKMVVASKKIQVTDINDKGQIEVVRKARIELKTARVAITKKGKEMREEANAFQKAVIAKEKELVAIIEPEEIRLEAIEDEVKAQKLKEERVGLLPIRKEQLHAIGDDIEVTDDELLDMDTETFSAYKNERISEKNQQDRLALEEAQRKVQEEADRQQREKETREREAIARKEEQEMAEHRIKEEKERAELRVQQEKADADRRVKEAEEKAKLDVEREKQRIAQEKYDKELADKAEQEKLDAKKKYQAWLTKNEYDEKTHYLRNENGTVTLYKIVSTFKI